MRPLTFILFAILLGACSEPVHEPDGFITSAGGDELVVDSLEEGVEYDLLEQPLPIYYFFKLSDQQLGTDYCYDEDDVKNLLMGDGPDEFTWTSKEVGQNYLRFENQECFVTTEFMFFGEDDALKAVLLQSGKGSQEAQMFGWNEGGGDWFELTDFPLPKMQDFYQELSADEHQLVSDYGVYFWYIKEQTGQISYQFSTWQMGLNADGKEIMDFNKDPDYSYLLNYDDEEGFWLQRVVENEDLQPKRYFLAYSENGPLSEDFLDLYDAIRIQLESYRIEAATADFTATNYQAFFTSDTIDFSAMQQFEPRNGYWFFEEGKEPLDLGFGEAVPTVNKAKRYFDEF